VTPDGVEPLRESFTPALGAHLGEGADLIGGASSSGQADKLAL
jgi:hypothetical protein